MAGRSDMNAKSSRQTSDTRGGEDASSGTCSATQRQSGYADFQAIWWTAARLHPGAFAPARKSWIRVAEIRLPWMAGH